MPRKWQITLGWASCVPLLGVPLMMIEHHTVAWWVAVAGVGVMAAAAITTAVLPESSRWTTSKLQGRWP
jgi:hypothetical protein